MSTTNEEATLFLLDKAEQTLDTVYMQTKEIIKARKELIMQGLQMIRTDEELDKEENQSLHELYIEDYKCLMKSLQDVTQLIEKGNREIGRMGMLSRDRESKNLWMAVAHNNVPKVKDFLKRGIADVDWENPYKFNETALMKASFSNHFDVCKLLVEGNANVNLSEKHGLTSMMFATRGNHLRIIKLLIEAGAKVDAQDKDGDTSLIKACLYGYQEIASFLLAEGASYTFEDSFGRTAGYYAVGNHGWNWNYMIAVANLSFFDHVFDCMVNADHSPLVEKKGGRKRKRGEDKEKKEEFPFLLRFMKRVYFSDLMMSKHILPKLSFNPGGEAGEGAAVQPVYHELVLG